MRNKGLMQVRRSNLEHVMTKQKIIGRDKMIQTKKTTFLIALTIRALSTILAATVICLAAFVHVSAQIASPYPRLIKQVAAPLPKVALMGAAQTTKGKIQYHKIVLTITNRDKFDPQMFTLPDGVKLPTNPCAGSRTRVVAAVYDDRGNLYSKCMPVQGKVSLGKVSFLVEKGKAIPNFVYIVLTDLKTSGAYRSNLVSPSTGATK